MLRKGDVLDNKYVVTEFIGQGGMGTVYKAVDQSLRRVVAIKEIHESLLRDTKQRQNFMEEAQQLVRLNHPAFPKVIVYLEEPESASQYIVMEYVDGPTLQDLLIERAEPFPLGQVLAWAGELLNALSYLHAQGVVHHDIKPSNLKLNNGRIVVLDFGLAIGGLTEHHAGEKSLVGYTANYASPEQISRRKTDARSDIYSLGATLYHLLTNELPEHATVREKVVEYRSPDPLKFAHELNPQVPPYISHALHQAMALKAEDRPANAREFMALLRPPAKGSKTPARRSAPGQAAALPAMVGTMARYRVPVVLVLLALVLSVVALLFISGQTATTDSGTPGAGAMAAASPSLTHNSEVAASLPSVTRANLAASQSQEGTASATPTRRPTETATATGRTDDDALAAAATATPRAVEPSATAPPPTATAPLLPTATTPPQPSATQPLPTATTAPPTATRFPTATPAPTLPPATATQARVAAPTLLSPGEGTSFSGPIRLAWAWNGTLGPDDYFDVRVWQNGQSHNGIAWTKERELVVEPQRLGAGSFNWSVAVIRGRNGSWEADLSPEAAPRSLIVNSGGTTDPGGDPPPPNTEPTPVIVPTR